MYVYLCLYFYSRLICCKTCIRRTWHSFGMYRYMYKNRSLTILISHCEEIYPTLHIKRVPAILPVSIPVKTTTSLPPSTIGEHAGQSKPWLRWMVPARCFQSQWPLAKRIWYLWQLSVAAVVVGVALALHAVLPMLSLSLSWWSWLWLLFLK